jgi:23S rRNA A1618 N6-methylase RlmF
MKYCNCGNPAVTNIDGVETCTNCNKPFYDSPQVVADEERESKLKELCDEQFLAKLTEVAKLYGWDGDYVEIARFVEHLHAFNNLPEPDMSACYEIKYKD